MNAPKVLSAASKRALHYTRGPEWFCQFRVSDLGGDFAYQEGVIRRDPSAVILVGDKYYTWYTKGEGEGFDFGGRQIKWGVAIADGPEGPYVKSEYNPVTNSGHEVCVWPYRGGVAALLTTDGPEKNTIQYAPDGINFEIVAVLKGAPEALGLYRGAPGVPGAYDASPLAGIEWGLCHVYHGGWQYIRRFETYRPRVI